MPNISRLMIPTQVRHASHCIRTSCGYSVPTDPYIPTSWCIHPPAELCLLGTRYSRVGSLLRSAYASHPCNCRLLHLHPLPSPYNYSALSHLKAKPTRLPSSWICYADYSHACLSASVAIGIQYFLHIINPLILVFWLLCQDVANHFSCHNRHRSNHIHNLAPILHTDEILLALVFGFPLHLT